MFNRHPEATSLMVSDMKISDQAMLKIIQHLKNTKVDYVDGLQATDAELKEIANNGSIAQLMLEGDKFSDEGISAIAHSNTLRALAINSRQISDEAMYMLAKDSHIEFLRFEGRDANNDKFINALVANQHLSSIGLIDANLDGSMVKKISKKPGLRALDLSYNPIDNAGVIEIAKNAPQLTNLMLAGVAMLSICRW